MCVCADFVTGAIFIKRMQEKEKDRKLPQVCVVDKIDWDIPLQQINPPCVFPFDKHTHTRTHINIHIQTH